MPLLEVKLELFEAEIRWVPELDISAKSGVHSMLNDWLHAFCGVGGLVSCFDGDEGKCTCLSFPTTIDMHGFILRVLSCNADNGCQHQSYT